MTTSLPPLPQDSGTYSPDTPNPSPNSGAQGAGGAPSPFGGGLPQMMQSMQQVESGLQTLATSLPSLAPMVAEMITRLRTAIPNAVAGANQSQPAPGTTTAAGSGFPPPPTPGQQ